MLYFRISSSSFFVSHSPFQFSRSLVFSFQRRSIKMSLNDCKLIYLKWLLRFKPFRWWWNFETCFQMSRSKSESQHFYGSIVNHRMGLCHGFCDIRTNQLGIAELLVYIHCLWLLPIHYCFNCKTARWKAVRKCLKSIFRLSLCILTTSIRIIPFNVTLNNCEFQFFKWFFDSFPRTELIKSMLLLRNVD